MSMAREKFLNGVYGVCPRILCHKQTVLPYGITDELKYTRVSVSKEISFIFNHFQSILIRFSVHLVKTYTNQEEMSVKWMEGISDRISHNTLHITMLI